MYCIFSAQEVGSREIRLRGFGKENRVFEDGPLVGEMLRFQFARSDRGGSNISPLSSMSTAL